MGSTKIVVDTTYIASAKSRLESLKQEYSASWSKVMRLKDEVDATWDGTDNDTYNERLEGFRDDFTDLERKIEDYIRFLGTAKEKYDTAQSTLEQTAKSTLAINR